MVRPTVLIDRFVAGIWGKVVKKKSSSREVHSFKKLDRDRKEAVEEGFSEYAEYIDQPSW